MNDVIQQEDEYLIAEIADMYYKKDMSQEQIAQKYFFSRSKVSRLLKRAKELGIVQVAIHYPFKRNHELEEHLKKIFKLKEVLILQETVDSISSTQEVETRRIAKFASLYLDSILFPEMVVGVSSGKTISMIAEEINPTRKIDIHFTQVKGMANQEFRYPYDSPPILRMFASKYGTHFSQVYSPLFVDNDIAREWLIKEPLISKVLDEAKRCDVLIASVSDFKASNEGIWSGYINEETQKAMVKEGAVGSMLSHFFKINGSVCNKDLDKKVIGLSVEDIQKIKNVVVVAIGRRKTRALYGAMNAHMVDTLICNEELANELLMLYYR